MKLISRLLPCCLAAIALVLGANPTNAAPARIFACSHQAFAQGFVAGGPDSIRESRLVVYFNEDLTDLQLGYANYIIGSTGEYKGGQGDVNVKFGLEYGGNFLPFQIKGTRLALCADGATLTTDALPVNIKAGTYGAIRTWEQKVAPGAEKNNWLWSTEADPAFGEGSVFHSQPDRDWTTGGAPGETASVSWKVDEAGAVFPQIAEPGSGIAKSGVTIGILDSQRKGSGFSTIATVKDGKLSGWYQQKNGTGYSTDVHLAPAGMGGYGAGGATQCFGPSVIVGTPAHAAKSILILGDSISAGFGAGDKRGDIWRNFGFYARALSKKSNLCNAAIPGLTAYSCDLGYGRTRSLVKSLLNPQIVLICLGTNDLDQNITDSGGKTSVAALKGHLAKIATWWQENCASEIWLGTILPRVKLNGADQTVGAAFGAGGPADTINAAIRDKTIFPAAAAIVDGRVLTQDVADPTHWRTDKGPLTTDGIHPNDATGIPWMAANITMPSTAMKP